MNDTRHTARGRDLSITDQRRARYALACARSNEALELRRVAKGKAAVSGASEWATSLERAETLTRPLVLELLGVRLAGEAADPVELGLANSMVLPAVLLLAGIWSIRSSAPKHPGLDDKQRGDDQTLRGHIRSAPSFGTAADLEAVPALDHATLVAYVGPGRMLSVPPTAYAAACYFAAGTPSDADRENALELLTFAFSEPAFRSLAPNDPWLDGLHGTSEWKAWYPTKVPPPLGPAS